MADRKRRPRFMSWLRTARNAGVDSDLVMTSASMEGPSIQSSLMRPCARV